jgi:hypothetical protein
MLMQLKMITGERCNSEGITDSFIINLEGEKGDNNSDDDGTADSSNFDDDMDEN